MEQDAMEAVRIYVGGLTPSVTQDALYKRFEPFGRVLTAEVAPPSSHGMWRGFGFVTFLPNSDKDLRKCLMTYHNCKWMGGRMSVEKAKPDFRTRLSAEWEEDRRQAETEARNECIKDGSRETTSVGRNSASTRMVLEGKRPGHLIDTSKARKLRKKLVRFDEVEPRTSQQLDWTSPATPDDQRWEKQRRAWKSLVDAGLAGCGLREVSSEVDSGAVLNFMSDDEVSEVVPGRLPEDNLGRFDTETDTSEESGMRYKQEATNGFSGVLEEIPMANRLEEQVDPGRSTEERNDNQSEPTSSSRSGSLVEDYIKAVTEYNTGYGEQPPASHDRAFMEEEEKPTWQDSKRMQEEDPTRGSGHQEVKEHREVSAGPTLAFNPGKAEPFVPTERPQEYKCLGMERFDDASSSEDRSIHENISLSGGSASCHSSSEVSEEDELAAQLKEEREKQRSVLKRLLPHVEEGGKDPDALPSGFHSIPRYDPTRPKPEMFVEWTPPQASTRPQRRVPTSKAEVENRSISQHETLDEPAPRWDAYQKSSWTDLVGHGGDVTWTLAGVAGSDLPDPPLSTRVSSSTEEQDERNLPEEKEPSILDAERPRTLDLQDVAPRGLQHASPLSKGDAFVRTVDMDVLVSAWNSQRGALLEDFKRKRRAALRALPRRKTKAG